MPELLMTGQFTFDLEAEGKDVATVALIGSLEVRNGVVMFDLLADYHLLYRRPAIVRNGVLVPRTEGEKKLWIVSRPVVDREKYPNWPEPEPGAYKRSNESSTEN